MIESGKVRKVVVERTTVSSISRRLILLFNNLRVNNISLDFRLDERDSSIL